MKDIKNLDWRKYNLKYILPANITKNKMKNEEEKDEYWMEIGEVGRSELKEKKKKKCEEKYIEMVKEKKNRKKENNKGIKYWRER